MLRKRWGRQLGRVREGGKAAGQLRASGTVAGWAKAAAGGSDSPPSAIRRRSVFEPDTADSWITELGPQNSVQ